jgi:hypothetical protein
MKDINKPEYKTWYICYSEGKEKRLHQNYIMPNQSFSTPEKFVLDTYKTESWWKKALIASGMSEQEYKELQGN